MSRAGTANGKERKKARRTVLVDALAAPDLSLDPPPDSDLVPGPHERAPQVRKQPHDQPRVARRVEEERERAREARLGEGEEREAEVDVP